MTIVDADVHISPTNEDAFAITTDELLKEMDRAQVDKAITWLRPPYMREIAESNRYVADAMRAHPDRIIGFGWVDPHLGIDRMREEIKRCVDDYGFYGVKLNGAQNNFFIDDPVLSLPLVEAIADTGTVVAFHIGTDAFEMTHPYRLGKIAEQFPDTAILMVHMGGVGFHDLSQAAIEVLQGHQNIMAVGSAIRPVNLLRAIKSAGAERICFGSDTPFSLMYLEVATYHALLDGEVSADEKVKIMSGNIIRFLNLKG